MPTHSKSFVCGQCGANYSKWSGRCDSCGAWNTIEQKVSRVSDLSDQGRPFDLLKTSNSSIDSSRIETQVKDIDDVLGGGLVKGSIILITGQPGIGKSTLLLQICSSISTKQRVLYVSGEESQNQIKLRASRIGVKPSNQLFIVNSNSADDIVATITKDSFDLVIVDSVQTLQTKNVPTSPGTPTQLNQSAHLLMQAAKLSGTSIIMVGHVTKEGDIAGPKLLEHLVDVVLSLEGDRYGGFKILRCSKNRFGSTHETGIFEMTEKGLSSVDNPSASLLAERQASDGSVVMATMEGSRPLLVEIQSLVTPSTFGYPKRTSSGFDLNRLNILLAMMNRRTKLDFSTMDVFINVVGGIKISEPAADLAILMSVSSAIKSLKLSEDLVVFGEVGLSGEVRHVPFVEKRLSESKKLGFKGAIGPKSHKKYPGLYQVSNIREAIAIALQK